MSVAATVTLLVLGAYLIGGIPFGLLAGFLRGVDVRQAGSRNIGATNVSRLLGRPFGVTVFSLDVAKGLVPMLVAGQVLAGTAARADLSDPTRYLCWLAVGAAAVLGHNYSVYLRFRGGKGVSTSLGVALGIYPWLTYPALAAFAVWVLVVVVSRYVSLGSMSAGVAFPIAFVAISRYRGQEVVADLWPLLAFSVLLAVMVLVRHRANLGRLLAGTESKIGRPKDDSAGHAKPSHPPQPPES